MKNIRYLAALLALGACDVIDSMELSTMEQSLGNREIDDSHEPRPHTAAALSRTADVHCEPHTRTVRHKDGSRQLSTSFYGIIDDVSIEDDFVIERCSSSAIRPQVVDCPADDTCTGSDVIATRSCDVTHRTGMFVDGKLTIYCGQRIENITAAGVSTVLYDYTIDSIKVKY